MSYLDCDLTLSDSKTSSDLFHSSSGDSVSHTISVEVAQVVSKDADLCSANYPRRLSKLSLVSIQDY
jgi:hypothetical protein